ncbi:hypothetical protein H2248_008018 [Termitomyces sp. 'cryptogamus']|nr:hypothetical protein H2248_008018 [Termitomyces sp. 'cryptogamus']
MAYQGQPKPGQSSQSSGRGGRPAQGQYRSQPQQRIQQYVAVTYPGHEEPLPYQTPVHVRMDVDEEEEVHYERGYYPGPSWLQGEGQSYVHAVAQPLVETYAPQAQMRMGTEVLLGHLEAAGQPVPMMAEFLQDDLAVMVMEGLLNQIELMRRQRVTTLEQIDRAAKRKLPIHKGSSVEPKRAKLQPPRLMEVARAVVPVVACPGPAVALTTPVLPAWPPAAPAQAAPIKSRVPDAPLTELSLEQRDEEMSNGPLDWDEMALLDAMNSGAHTCTSVS